MGMDKFALITGGGARHRQSVGAGARRARLERGARGPAPRAARRRPRARSRRWAAGASPIAATSATPTRSRALFAAVESEFGRLDLLFNNAGVERARRADGGTDLRAMEDRGRRQPDRRLPLRAGRDAADEAQSPRGGRIINNGSISAHAPRPNSAPYTATKHAITGLTKSIALDGRQFDIACGQIDIGNALTEMAYRMTTGRAAGRRPHRDRADDRPQRGRRRDRAHGEPAALDQHPDHDDHGDQDAVRGQGMRRGPTGSVSP